MRPGPPFLILASASPRRRELLEQYGYCFEIRVPDVIELESEALTLRELTIHNATRKALAVAETAPGAVVLAADTLISLGGKVIGKPRDLEEAAAILKRLSGRTHEVCTAVSIRCADDNWRSTFVEISSVQFKRLTNDAIRRYLTTVDPLDKAGAYAAQSSSSEIIARIEGSFTNVVGLPMERTIPELRRFGIRSERLR